MTLPNFLIIGAQKAGTTSLYHYLRQHPEIYMSPVKEPRFFYPEFYTADKLRPCQRTTPLTMEEYTSLFNGVSTETAIGEASTDYLHSAKAPELIAQTLPEVKVIAILRNPVERAFSAFCYQTRDGYEYLSFAAAIEETESGLRDYLKLGFYYGQVKRYLETFAEEQVKIHLTDDLYRDPNSMLIDICDFLDVSCTFEPSLEKKNVSGIPKSRFLHDIFLKDNPVKTILKPLFPARLRKQIHGNVRKINLAEKPILEPELRLKLIEVYREDILKLQDLINQDLSPWMK